MRISTNIITLHSGLYKKSANMHNIFPRSSLKRESDVIAAPTNL